MAAELSHKAVAALSLSGDGAKARGLGEEDARELEEKEGEPLQSLVVRVFDECLEQQSDMAVAVAAIKALTACVDKSGANTMMGLEIELKAASDALQERNRASISLAAGCELFNRYVTRTSLELGEFERCRERLISRGAFFAGQAQASRQTIARFGDRFLRDGTVVLVHGYSRVVLSVLLHAAQQGGKYLSVIVTEGRPRNSGARLARKLEAAGIPTTLVLDTAAAYVMDRADLVLVGAEGVVESGGIINQTGTYQLAMVAKALHTPLYVAAESYKFARLFPLTQSDLPEPRSEQKELRLAGGGEVPGRWENPSTDYTPPQYITLLFTDLGILTPSAVSDELIKLYS